MKLVYLKLEVYFIDPEMYAYFTINISKFRTILSLVNTIELVIFFSKKFVK